MAFGACCRLLWADPDQGWFQPGSGSDKFIAALDPNMEVVNENQQNQLDLFEFCDDAVVFLLLLLHLHQLLLQSLHLRLLLLQDTTSPRDDTSDTQDQNNHSEELNILT